MGTSSESQWSQQTISSFYSSDQLGFPPGSSPGDSYTEKWSELAQIVNSSAPLTPYPHLDTQWVIGYLAFKVAGDGTRSFDPDGGLAPGMAQAGFTTQFCCTPGSSFSALLADGRIITGTPTFTGSNPPAPVPEPSALFLFLSSLGLSGVSAPPPPQGLDALRRVEGAVKPPD